MHHAYRFGALLALIALLAAPSTAQTRLFADLAGENEVPAVMTDASGSVRVLVSGTTLQVTGSFDDLESDFNTAIGAHIHEGSPDENGPVRVSLVPTLDSDLRGGRFLKRNNTFEVSEEIAGIIRRGNAYVNIHSVDNPGGEIRGQLLPRGEQNKTLVQVIHNAPDPGAAVVDVYLNGTRVLDDLAFRSATPFIDAPANEDLVVGIAPGSSTSAADILYTETFNLPPASRTQVIAQGVLSPGDFSSNPSGRSTAFDLVVGADAQLVGPNPNRAALRAVHGSPDAPTVDIRVNGRIVVDDASFGDVTGYLAAPLATVDVAVTTASGATVVTYEADLTDFGGQAATVLASGFLSPEDDQNGPAFGLLLVLADGSSVLLPVSGDDAQASGKTQLTPAAFALDAPYPNPASGAATVSFGLAEGGAARVAVYDALGREVAVVAEGTYEAGRHTASLAAGMPAGVYVVRLEAEGQSQTQRLTVVR